MNTAQTGKFGMFEPGYHSEYSFLFAVFKFGLKTDDIAQSIFFIVLPQLYHGIRFFRSMRIGQSDRLHRPE